MKQWEKAAKGRNYDVALQMDKIIINTEARLLAVVKQSLKEMIEEDMQVPTAKGGRMRVKTGFLRSSGVAALNSTPSGPSKGDETMSYEWDGKQLDLTLAKLKIGDTFYFGWSANYAKYREAYDGFLEAGLQNWQLYVNKAVRYFKAKDMKK